MAEPHEVERVSKPELPRQYFTYMLGVVLQKIAGFALIPLYTSRLSTADYGILELLTSFTGLASLFVILGVPGAVNKCYHRDCRSEREREELVGTSVLFTVPMAMLIVVVAFLFDRQLAAVLFEQPDWAPYVRLALISLATMQVSLIPMELMRTLGRAGQYVTFSILQMLVQVGLSVLLLVRFELGVSAVLLANIASYAATQIGATVFLLRHSRLTFSWRHLKHLAAFGLLLVPISACGWIVNVSDRFFLQRFVGDAQVGLYGLGYKFGILIEVMLVLPFQKAWNPYYFSIADDPKAGAIFAKTLTYYVALLGLGVGLLSVCGGPALRLLAQPNFYPAASVIPPVALSYALSGLVMCLSTGLIVAGRTRLVALIAAAGAAINIAFNLVLIPPLGMMGAAWSTLLTFAATCILTTWAVARSYPVPVEGRRLAKVLVSAALLSALAATIRIQPSGLELVARAAVLLAVPGVLLALNFFSAEERAIFRSAATRLTTVAGLSRAN